jgi:hypothetical protein
VQSDEDENISASYSHRKKEAESNNEESESDVEFLGIGESKPGRKMILPLEEWKHRQVITYPVHAQEGKWAHWTLAALINCKWSSELSVQTQWSWAVFSFNESSTDLVTKRNTIGLAQYITTTNNKQDIVYCRVPIKDQDSNGDCGLYPAYFLGHLLQNLEECLDAFDQVSFRDSMSRKAKS